MLEAFGLRIERALERSWLLGSLRETREQALRVVGLTLEHRDYETKGHTDRVAALAVRLGEAMLRQLDFLPETVLQIVRSHHERWDGSGYPDGLAGESIPLLCRAFAVVDVYDALVSERPYKRAWTPEEARAELRRQRGTQFDPRVVDAFLGL